MLLQWSKDLAVGHAIVDNDHQMLINIANDVAYAFKSGAGDEAVNRALKRLAQYVEMQFKREEALFMTSRYPHKDKHQQNHRNIEKLVRDFQAAYGEDPAQANLVNFLNFFKDWLVRHIDRLDKGYVPYVQAAEKHTGRPPAARTGFV